MSTQLIIHADDFNLTPGVSRGIIRAHQSGVVTSTSVMVNGADLGEAARLLSSCPDLDVGLHVTLSWGRPLSPPASVPTLVNHQGFFRLRHSVENVDPRELQAEVQAQYHALLQAGIQPTHLDSHHYLQDHPPVLEALVLLAEHEGLAVRSSSPETRLLITSRDIPTPTCFEAGFFGSDNISLKHFLELVDTLPDGICELNCHPGEVDESLARISSYVEARGEELVVLTSPELQLALTSRELKLVSYRMLLPGR